MAFKFKLPTFIAALALPLTACSTPSCLDKSYSWDYDRMPLAEAIQKVSERSSCPIQINPDLTENKSSHEIHLNRQPYQAMRHMLWGTGLKVAKTDQGLKIISRRSAENTAPPAGKRPTPPISD